MGAAWVDHPSWELVDDASLAADRDVAMLLLEADAEELRDTRNAQLATFVLSMVVLDAVERLGISPALAAGHSLGEYSALVAVGALSFDDGVRVVAERGEAMQSAAEDNPGTMAAILGLDDDQCDVACRRADGDVWVANYNAPGQVVIAGSSEAVAVAGDIARQLGAKKTMMLPVGGAFHTPFMTPARQRLRKALAEAAFADCEVAVVANVDNTGHTAAEDWPSLLSAQLGSPVRWRQSLLEMAATGVSLVAELGPGGVLTGLARRGLPDVRGVAVATPADLDKLVEAVAPSTHLRGTPRLQDGEHLYVHERLVVSPAAGVFTPDDSAARVGSAVDVGGLLGRVGSVDVRSAFAGVLQGMLAVDGERVMTGEPIAWLRST
jgi:[acyl-carrier-protein] S-malonyltransferase